jgi:pyrophosphatase PpaX
MTRPAILFDLDGTLIDTIELILSSARHAFEGWPRGTPTDQEWVRGIGTPLVQQLRSYTETEDEVALLLDRYRRYQAEHHDQLTRCYDDVPEVLAALSVAGTSSRSLRAGVAHRPPEPPVRRDR